MKTALIYDNVKYQNDTAMLLDDSGFTVNLSFSIDSPWFDVVKTDRPDILIISIAVPDERILHQLKMFHELVICPVVVLAYGADESIIEAVIFAGADSCVVGDISVERVTSLLQINLARYKVTRGRLEEIQELNKNIESLEARLNDRKDIERAKGMLMSSYKMNENDAYNAMRRMAMDTGNKLGEVARNLISMSKVLR